jgi:hypothetical protein
MGGGDKEWRRGWIQLWYIVRTLINVTMYPQYNNNKKCWTRLGMFRVVWP